jgi:hypothetical protein
MKLTIIKEILYVLVLPLLALFLTCCTTNDSVEERAIFMTKAKLDVLCASLDMYKEHNKIFVSKQQGLEILIEDADADSKVRGLHDGWKRVVVPIYKDDMIIGISSYGSNGIDENGAGDDMRCFAN